MMSIKDITNIYSSNELDIKIYRITEFKQRYVEKYDTFHRGIYGDSHIGVHYDEVVILAQKLKKNTYTHLTLNNIIIRISLLVAIHELGHIIGLEHCYSSLCFLTFGELAYEKDKKLYFRASICQNHVNSMKDDIKFTDKVKRILNQYFG